MAKTTNELMNNVKSTINNVKKMIGHDIAYTPYVKLIIGSNNLLTIETGRDHDIITRLDVQKNGTGKANTVSIDLAFAPDASIVNGKGWGDPCFIDKILCSCDMKLFLTYGYTTAMNGSTSKLLSPTYELWISDYHVELNNNLLIYTIDAISMAASKVEKTMQFPTWNNVRPTLIFKGAVDNYLKEYTFVDRDGILGKDQIVGEIKLPACNIFDFLRKVCNMAVEESQGNAGVTDADKKKNYEFVINDTMNNKTIELIMVDAYKEDDDSSPEIIFDWGTSKSNQLVKSFQTDFNGIVMMTAAAAMDTDSVVSADPTNSSIAMAAAQVATLLGSDPTFYNSNTQDDYISMAAAQNATLVGSDSTFYSSDPLAGTDPTLRYYHDMHGTTATSTESIWNNNKSTASMTAIRNNNDVKSRVINNSVVSMPGITEIDSSSMYAEIEGNINLSRWSRAINQSYKAQIDMMGLPCEIPIGGVIKIIPLIWGRAYHTAGNYMITKITDHIDSEGFTTGMELFKLCLMD